MKANLVANVYYWLGYIISDIEQVDGYSGLRGKIDELRDAINDLIHGRGGRMKLKWQQKNDKECYSYVFGTPLMCVVYHEDGKTARELQLEKETNAKLTARWIEGARRKASRGIFEDVGHTKAEGRILFEDNDEDRRELEHCIPKQKYICNPIVDWSEETVWRFIKDQGGLGAMRGRRDMDLFILALAVSLLSIAHFVGAWR